MENLTTKVDNDMRFVVKRSGNKVPYMVDKIENAVLKAMNSVGNVDEEMAEKIARGRLNKFFKETTLLNQSFIRDNKKTVSQFLKESNPDLKVTDFKRYSLSI